MTEDDDIVETIDEFRSERTFDLFVDARFHAVVGRVGVGLLESKRRFILDGGCAGVRRHDDNRVAKINKTTKAVG